LIPVPVTAEGVSVVAKLKFACGIKSKER